MNSSSVDDRNKLRKKILWWSVWLTLINAFLYYIVVNATPLLTDRASMTPREIGYAVGYAITAPPPPGIVAEIIGAALVPWLLVGLVCLLARIFKKGSFRSRVVNASPFVLAIGLLSMVAITQPIWNANY